jgi:hypothetical protein
MFRQALPPHQMLANRFFTPQALTIACLANRYKKEFLPADAKPMLAKSYGKPYPDSAIQI